mmetsp:Transcript_124085/g.247167  ORF Transcript_124085/g.247167 Transcript_124085/m.247167 type:complete len:245 (-) Transcript_124085:923-1657(-)
MLHSSSPTPASHRWVSKMADSTASARSRNVAWKDRVVDQPWTAIPVDKTADATPKTRAITGARRAAPATAAVPLPLDASSASTATLAAMPAPAKPLTTEAPNRPASVKGRLESLPTAARTASVAASHACSHSRSNSATAKLFQVSLMICPRNSPRATRSPMVSPVAAAPPTAAEPMPKAIPAGGKTNMLTAEAMPSPALRVLVLLTATHWFVCNLSRECRSCNDDRRMSCSSFAAAISRMVVLV